MTIVLTGTDGAVLTGADLAVLTGVGTDTVLLGPAFYAVSITAFTPGVGAVSYALGWGTTPWGTLTEQPTSFTATSAITASDIGYRTAPTDGGGPTPYPPLVAEAVSIDRQINLDLTSSNIAASWGSINLSNAGGAFDAIAATWNNDGRPATVLRGSKGVDLARGLLLDPSISSLTTVFAGISTAWSLTDTALVVPLRDASYWMEKPAQSAQYAGTGTYEGTASLTGTSKPKTRGTVYNVTPVLVDPTNLIYQYTDGPGTLTTLYEGGYANRTFQANTTNLYSGTTTSGLYRTDNSRGLFQLGNTPTGAITCDCTGAFPVAGSQTDCATIALYLLSEDLAVPSANINTASFTAAAAAYPYSAGIHLAGAENVDGVTAVDRVLTGMAAMLYPARDGTLCVLVLRAPATGTTSEAVYTTDNTVSIKPIALPASLLPPPFRVRIGYQHNYTVQASGLLGGATSTYKQFVAQPDRYAGASSGTTQTTYARPNDHDPIGISLINQADAQIVANALLALWGTRRRLYAVELPVDTGIQREIGDVVQLVWPMEDLAAGQLGTVVGDSFRSEDATLTLKVLV
jgi:hypothetical protein